jgi:hypothetical protein
MPRIARFWDALSRFGRPPSCQQPGMCSENSGLRQTISELVQRSGKALRHGFEPRLESLALRLGPIGCPRSVSVVLPWCSANPPILDDTYVSPPSSPGGSMHGCHCSSSAWASQNHLLHVVQRTVAG